MKDLIKIEEKDGIETVNARELHSFIESKQEFANWIKNRIEKYGFIKDEDFMTSLSKTSNGRPATEYYITLDMAKELSMVENNQKGQEARRWFIAREKQASELANDPIIRLRLDQMRIEKKLASVEEQVNLITPEPGFFTILAWGRNHRIRLDNAKAQSLGVMSSKLCRKYGMTAGNVPDARFGSVKSYPEEVIDEAWEIYSCR